VQQEDQPSVGGDDSHRWLTHAVLDELVGLVIRPQRSHMGFEGRGNAPMPLLGVNLLAASSPDFTA
jgi:hypothetical protein